MSLERIYPVCRSIMGERAWALLIARLDMIDSATFPEALALRQELALPDYLPELAQLERARLRAATANVVLQEVETPEINPTLELLHLNWNLVSCFPEQRNAPLAIPKQVKQWALVWQTATGKLRVEAADSQDLLALKIAAEKIAVEDAAKAGQVKTQQIEATLFRAAKKGLILIPGSLIRRKSGLAADTFTLQWHLTNACDFHCKHCYDRSPRTTLSLQQACAVVDDLRKFCRNQRVMGHVCLAGGNPLLYPHFIELYRYIVDCGFSTSILGNPTSREKIRNICEIRPPDMYQVSLEGLPSHNDFIRGQGHFASVLEFLGLLRDFSIPSAVMLTLTKSNAWQVIPLAEKLRGHTRCFCFSRLSQMGEGKNIEALERDKYQAFLESYLDAARDNPIMAQKDNLFNIVLYRRKQPLFAGCTGHSGCGAAFNALAVLPNGEVHACRKFPSPLGNLLQETIAEIYDCEQARLYRKGSEACRNCSIRHVCGGCMAISRGCGLDELTQRDPHCFME